MITERRKALGISHETLGKMTGLHRSTVSLIESKKRIPTILTLFMICKALDISLGDIIKECE